MMLRHNLLLAAALLILDSTLAMIWHPKNPKNSMWDTWLYAQPGQDAVRVQFSSATTSFVKTCYTSSLPIVLAVIVSTPFNLAQHMLLSSIVSVRWCTADPNLVQFQPLCIQFPC